MNRPTSKASTPLATADVVIEEREFQWTTISRFDFFASERFIVLSQSVIPIDRIRAAAPPRDCKFIIWFGE